MRALVNRGRVAETTRNEELQTMLGAHVSTSGGIDKSPANGAALGCEAIQIFTRNQRQWHAAPLDPKIARRFRDERDRHGIQSAIAHGSYLFNLAGSGRTLALSREGLVDEWDRAEALGLDGVVLHPGSHLGQGVEEGVARVVASLDAVAQERPRYRTPILLETTAGQGSNLGASFEEIRAMLDGVKRAEHFGVCIDTAHLFAAGYDLRTERATAEVLDSFDRIVGLDRLRAIHLNDSKVPRASRVDRHENLSHGKIGLGAFRCLVNDPRLKKLPMVLETPGGDDGYRNDLRILRGLERKRRRPLAKKPKAIPRA